VLAVVSARFAAKRHEFSHHSLPVAGQTQLINQVHQPALVARLTVAAALKTEKHCFSCD